MSGRVDMTLWLLGLIGGTAGAVIGYLAFFFLARQGFYAMVLPGACVGLGCGWQSGVRSNALGVLSALGAAALGLFIEWQFAPFQADGSFLYFLKHVQELKSATLVMMGLGAFFGFWFGRGRAGGVWPRRKEPKSESRDEDSSAEQR